MNLKPLAFALALLAATPAFAAETLDSTPRIAVMSAFQPEWVQLQGKMQGRTDQEVNGVTFATGDLGGKPVVLFLSGVSMVNAAMSTQLAIDHFDIKGIVFSGIAGGVDPSRHIGDVIVPEQWAEYLETIFARDVGGKFTPPGFLPTELPNFGMMFPQDVGIARSGGKIEKKRWFPVDATMLEVARTVAADTKLNGCAKACLAHSPEIHVGGNGVSGQAFVDNAAFRDYAFQTFGAEVLDMESAAVAHVAYANGVPFIAFRSLSDLAGGGEGENEMGTFMQLASDNSASVVEKFLQALP